MYKAIIFFALILHKIKAVDLEPQYGFAHRVNSKNEIAPVLMAGINGIEIDVCYDENYADWYVSHYDFSVCYNGGTDTLKDWLLTLNNFLINNQNGISYIDQLAMIWLDFKNPGNVNINLVPNIVHSVNLPSQIKILYDFVKFDDNGKYAFQQIKNLLNTNEAVSFCAGKSCDGSLSSIQDIYNYCNNEAFSNRCTFNSGDSLSIDNNFLIQANSNGYPLVFTWTTSSQTQINDYMNPNNLYQTNGQIIGPFWRSWETSSDSQYIDRFINAINTHSSTQRLATSNDDPFNAGKGDTMNPTSQPTKSPSTKSPSTHLPSVSPTNKPTVSPTNKPTDSPTNNPTVSPTNKPTSTPTNNPILTPTDNPTPTPTDNPTPTPTHNPTPPPTDTPTSTPTDNSTPVPTPRDDMTSNPTYSPSPLPTSRLVVNGVTIIHNNHASTDSTPIYLAMALMFGFFICCCCLIGGILACLWYNKEKMVKNKNKITPSVNIVSVSPLTSTDEIAPIVAIQKDGDIMTKMTRNNENLLHESNHDNRGDIMFQI